MQVQYINIIIISSTDFLFSLIIYFFGVGAGKQIIYGNFIQLEGEAAFLVAIYEENAFRVM